MTPSDYDLLVRQLRGLGLNVISVDTQTGTLVVQIPPLRHDQ